MRRGRYRMLKLVSMLTVGTTIGLGTGLAKIKIPLDEPPVSKDILTLEESARSQLKDCSEDKPITLSELAVALGNPDGDKLNDALLHLLWKDGIKEVDDGSFCLVRSSAG